MKKRGVDALEIIADFHQEIARVDKTTDAMWQEVLTMRFKIRPLAGDVLALNLKDKSFVQALWNLGKLEEFFHRHYRTLSTKQRKIFFDMFDNLHEKFERELNKLQMPDRLQETPFNVEMEIFKEYPPKKRLN